MFELKGKQVLVIGLGGRGAAACDLLLSQGADVLGVDQADSAPLRDEAERLRGVGVQVALGVKDLRASDFALAVVSPSVALNSPCVQSALARAIPVVSELELGLQQAHCLSIAIAGTNGKATTAMLVERILAAAHRKTLIAGHRAQPVCSVIEQSRDLDYLILQASALQLASTRFFRPTVSVLLNLAPDHLDRFSHPDDLVRAYAALFKQQQAFDWAIIQSEALAVLKRLNLPVPAKTITFSASDPEADLHLDRGLIISRLPNWPGPLLDMDHCCLRGPHNAENIMAALAVGRVLRLPLETMLDPLKKAASPPHCCELVREVNGVRFINDSKATNLDALHKAILSVQPAPGRPANLLLIAGGVESGQPYHDLAPLLSSRVKHVFLIGQASAKIRSAWSLFTPCTLSASLIEAIAEAAKNALSGDVVLLSPACSSFDQFRDYKNRGEIFCQTVKSISGGGPEDTPNR